MARFDRFGLSESKVRHATNPDRAQSGSCARSATFACVGVIAQEGFTRPGLGRC